MTKINLIYVGNIKEDYIKQGIAEFQKRLKPYVKIREIALSEYSKAPSNPSQKDILHCQNVESQLILDKVSQDDFVVLLDVQGKMLSSEQFASQYQKWYNATDALTFVIGGSYGHSDVLRKRANFSLSFSTMTFPHQLFRLLFFEQLYRIQRINHNHAYHK